MNVRVDFADEILATIAQVKIIGSDNVASEDTDTATAATSIAAAPAHFSFHCLVNPKSPSTDAGNSAFVFGAPNAAYGTT